MCKSAVWESNAKRGTKRWPSSRIDKCLTHLISAFNGHPNMVSLASCCGHGIYPMTIVVKDYNTKRIFELLSDKTIHGRTERFYRSDSRGRYYIPEVSVPIG